MVTTILLYLIRIKHMVLVEVVVLVGIKTTVAVLYVVLSIKKVDLIVKWK
jgi:hypothetical protein